MTAASTRDYEAAHALAVLDLPGFGARKALDAFQHFGSAAAAYERLTGPNATDRVTAFAAEHPLHDYLGIVHATYALGGSFKLWTDADYPANLSQWQGRPPVLFFKGDLGGLAPRALALVGRVDPTPAGVDAAERFARLCVENGINVVSGLAKGIDGASHRAALEDPPGQTYAVVGHGLDFAYPAQNRDLYAAIPDHGAVISQFPTGTGPQRWTFPARNEVMCTLALGTVIIEAKEGCGSIIQADFSFKHGRPVFILSRNLKVGDADWARQLVARGAHVIERFDQVLDLVEKAHGALWNSKPREEAMFELEDLTMTTEPRAALFDIDGVIASTMDAERLAVAELASHSLRQTVEPVNVPTYGSPIQKLAALGVPDADAVYRASYTSVWERHAGDPTIHEVVETIGRLKADGWKIGAITSNNKQRAEILVPAELRAQFDAFLTYGNGGKDKAAAIGALISKWNVRPDRAFYIGDQPKDLVSARQAGVMGIAVLWGFGTREELAAEGPALILETPAETLSLLDLF